MKRYAFNVFASAILICGLASFTAGDNPQDLKQQKKRTDQKKQDSYKSQDSMSNGGVHDHENPTIMDSVSRKRQRVPLPDTTNTHMH
jgi:hypothetical protein